MWYNDMHVHTASSPDAEVPAAKLSRMAVSAGVERIGFVAHLDMHPDDLCHGGFQETGYMEELDLASAVGGARVLRGIEVGEPHRFMDEAMKLFHPEEYDFITGALHWLNDELILEREPFLSGSPVDIVGRYYTETLEILEKGGVSIIAHMGIFRRGMARAGLMVDFDETTLFPKLLRKVLETAIKRETAVEVNTAGLRRPENTTYPTPSVLRLYRQLGGRMITLGSDTHTEENAFFGLNRGVSMIRDCGFNEYGYFRRGAYTPCPLHPQ